MSDTPRAKMSIENRAKQFAPFNSLPGLYEALAQVEAEVELSLRAESNTEKTAMDFERLPKSP